MIDISIFTPVFNRAHTIERVYRSLLLQNHKCFEWIVVDDGSVDGIEHIIRDMLASAPFPIKFVSQPNQGKHVAHNRALDLARGRYFLILDSDDWLVPKATDLLLAAVEDVEQIGQNVVGFSMLSLLEDGAILGEKFPRDRWIGRFYEYIDAFNIKGDKQNIVRTDILRLFRYPEFEGELQVAPGLIWNRICGTYEFLHLNVPIQKVDYQPDGLSAKIVRMQALSPNSTELFYHELSQLNVRKVTRIKAMANIIRYRLHNGNYRIGGVKWNNYIELCSCSLLGSLLFLKDFCAERVSAFRHARAS